MDILAKTSIVFLFLNCLICCPDVLGQLKDHFDDGELLSSPSWNNAEGKFTVTDQQLKLEAPALAGTAVLCTPNKVISVGSWSFYVKLAFTPSSSNYTRIYLASDAQNFTGPLNGYFVQIGSADRDVCLYRQVGTTLSKIIDGEDDQLNSTEVELRIRVNHTSTGEWTLMTATGNGDYDTVGTQVDNTHVRTNYFGILCRYTSTRADKFYFDDFMIDGTFDADTIAPKIISLTTTSSRELAIEFNEEIDQSSASEITHFLVNDGIGSPSLAIAAEKSVVLSFNKDFSEGITLELSVSQILDLDGNEMPYATIPFTFIITSTASFKDVVITEVMADPKPAVDLPEVEFVEIFNRSDKSFNLKDWTLSNGSDIMTLPVATLTPGSYLIITLTDELIKYGPAIADKRFPSLVNTNDDIIIKDPTAITIDSIHYNSGWYKDNSKINGGWSLELIDPNNVCSDEDNWHASLDKSGGTPGIGNSVAADKPDLTGPRLLNVFPLSHSTLEIVFNEKVRDEIPVPSSFLIEPPVEITNIKFKDRSLRKLILTIDEQFQPELSYQVIVTGVFDCAGNEISVDHNKLSFGLPSVAAPGDIVINEILFNPYPGGSDFVEIVNNSSKYINLKNFLISNIESGILQNDEKLAVENHLFAPAEYVALTEDATALLSNYPLAPADKILEVDKLPSLNDDEGSIALSDSGRVILDFLYYSQDLHSIFIKDPEGVSLERTSTVSPAGDPKNWTSASTHSGYATPGYLNSNSLRQDSPIEQSVTIEPEVLIPIFGQPSFVRINYNFETGGYVANVRILDEQGNTIRTIAGNEIIGASGYWRWDGDRDNGRPARIGYYMVWLEVFDSNGDVRIIRKRLAVSANF